MSIAAVIPAAGLSSRMGSFKPLLPIGGRPALQMAIETAKEAGCIPYVVTGYRREELVDTIFRSGGIPVDNPDYQLGMFSSVKAALNRLIQDGSVEGCALWPCDCPLIPSRAVRQVIDRAEKNRCTVAACCGRRGHPLYIPRRLFEGIAAYTGEGGLKGALAALGAVREEIEVDTDLILPDMDTPEGYQAVQRLYRPFIDLASLARGRRLTFLRHGDTEPQSDRIFMGKTDIPLSETGILQAKNAAEGLEKPAAIFTSPLMRALQTGGILADRFGVTPTTLGELSEIDLGQWDGRLIRDIQQTYPKDYEARGRALPLFAPPGGESFFDLRRRVAEGLFFALQHSKGAILLVTHLGVIQCARSLLLDIPLRDAVNDRTPPKGGHITIEIR